jgi:hypothetical protein
VQIIAHATPSSLDQIVLIQFVMEKVQLIQLYALEMEIVYPQMVVFALQEDTLDHFAILLFVQM